jgi:transcriptional repressor NrdR
MIEDVASQVEEDARLAGPDVTSERIGQAVLERLRVLDDVAYLRFASVHKDFAGAADFAREADLLDREDEHPEEG